MFHINYDLARQITEERRAWAIDRYRRRRAKTETTVPPHIDLTEADVIELAFGTHCEPEKIGA